MKILFNPFWNKALPVQNVEQIRLCEYFPDALDLNVFAINTMICNEAYA